MIEEPKSLSRPSSGTTGSLTIRVILKKIMPHAAVQIYLWACLTVALQLLHGNTLSFLAALVILISVTVGANRFLQLLRRTRWIFISVFFIYAYASPGESLWPQLGVFSPIGNGIVDGLAQLERLAAILAGLAVALTLLTQSQLLGGLYTLFYPVSLFGFQRKRIALRLALTLQYAQQVVADSAANWRERFEQMIEPQVTMPDFYELHVDSMSRSDWMLVLLASAVLGGMWL